MSAELEWVEIECTKPRPRVKAVRLTPENAQAVADHFGGKVQVVPGTFGGTVTRVSMNTKGPGGWWSGPATGWVTEKGVHLDDSQWAEGDTEWPSPV